MSRPRRQRRGNILVFVAAAALLFLSLVALVVDVGGWYNDRAQMQAVADLAVEVIVRRFPGAPTGTPARTLLRKILVANGLQPEVVKLEPAAAGVELEIAWLRPRRFSNRRGRSPQRITVRARAQRSRLGEVSLVP